MTIDVMVNGAQFNATCYNASINLLDHEGERVAFIQADDGVEQAFYFIIDKEHGSMGEFDAPRDIYDSLTNEDYLPVVEWLASMTFE